MKKCSFLAISIICCFFISCKNETVDPAVAAAAKNKANTLKVFKAIETGDVSVLDSLMAKDAIDHSGPNGPIVGLDSIKAYLADVHNQFDGLKMSMVADATDGDYEFTLARMEGVCKTGSMGMPAGTKCNMLSVDVVKLKDGKMTDHWSYMDPNDMMKMMGGTPPPPPPVDAKKADGEKTK